MADLYTQNEGEDCQHCEHLCQGLQECQPSYCAAANIFNGCIFLPLLLFSCIKFIQMHREYTTLTLKKSIYILTICMCVLAVFRQFLIQFTSIQQTVAYLDALLYWQSFSFIFSQYILVALFWLSLRQRRGFTKQQLVWGRARQVNIAVNVFIFTANFLIPALQTAILPTYFELIIIVCIIYTLIILSIGVSFAITGYLLYRMLSEMPDSDQNKPKLMKAIKTYSTFAVISFSVAACISGSYYLFVLVGGVNYIACQTWNISFRLEQVIFASLILWPLRKKRDNTQNTNSATQEKSRNDISLRNSTEKPISIEGEGGLQPSPVVATEQS